MKTTISSMLHWTGKVSYWLSYADQLSRAVSSLVPSWKSCWQALCFCCVWPLSGSVQAQTEYVYQSQFGSLDLAQFNSPTDVALDGQGNIYVAGNLNDRIQKFNASGQFLLAIGSQGTGNGQFDNPNGVAVDGQGNIYVADEDNNRIRKFNASSQSGS